MLWTGWALFRIGYSFVIMYKLPPTLHLCTYVRQECFSREVIGSPDIAQHGTIFDNKHPAVLQCIVQCIYRRGCIHNSTCLLQIPHRYNPNPSILSTHRQKFLDLIGSIALENNMACIREIVHFPVHFITHLMWFGMAEFGRYGRESNIPADSIGYGILFPAGIPSCSWA